MRRLLIVVLLAGLAACDSGREDLSAGEFKAEITGGLSVELEGNAFFREIDVGPSAPTLLSIVLLDTTNPVFDRAVTLSAPGGVITGPGMYSVGLGGGEESLSLVYTDVRGNTTSSLVALSGTLEVTRFEAGRIAGSFSAVLGTPSSSVSAEGTGRFDAALAEVVAF